LLGDCMKKAREKKQRNQIFSTFGRIGLHFLVGRPPQVCGGGGAFDGPRLVGGGRLELGSF